MEELVKKLSDSSQLFQQDSHLALMNAASGKLGEAFRQQFMAVIGAMQPRSLTPVELNTMQSFMLAQNLLLPSPMHHFFPFFNNPLAALTDDGNLASSSTSPETCYTPTAPAQSEDQEAAETLQELRNTDSTDVLNNNCDGKQGAPSFRRRTRGSRSGGVRIPRVRKKTPERIVLDLNAPQSNEMSDLIKAAEEAEQIVVEAREAEAARREIEEQRINQLALQAREARQRLDRAIRAKKARDTRKSKKEQKIREEAARTAQAAEQTEQTEDQLQLPDEQPTPRSDRAARMVRTVQAPERKRRGRRPKPKPTEPEPEPEPEKEQDKQKNDEVLIESDTAMLNAQANPAGNGQGSSSQQAMVNEPVGLEKSGGPMGTEKARVGRRPRTKKEKPGNASQKAILEKEPQLNDNGQRSASQEAMLDVQTPQAIEGPKESEKAMIEEQAVLEETERYQLEAAKRQESEEAKSRELEADHLRREQEETERREKEKERLRQIEETRLRELEEKRREVEAAQLREKEQEAAKLRRKEEEEKRREVEAAQLREKEQEAAELRDMEESKKEAERRELELLALKEAALEEERRERERELEATKLRESEELKRREEKAAQAKLRKAQLKKEQEEREWAKIREAQIVQEATERVERARKRLTEFGESRKVRLWRLTDLINFAQDELALENKRQNELKEARLERQAAKQQQCGVKQAEQTGMVDHTGPLEYAEQTEQSEQSDELVHRVEITERFEMRTAEELASENVSQPTEGGKLTFSEVIKMKSDFNTWRDGRVKKSPRKAAPETDSEEDKEYVTVPDSPRPRQALKIITELLNEDVEDLADVFFVTDHNFQEMYTDAWHLVNQWRKTKRDTEEYYEWMNRWALLEKKGIELERLRKIKMEELDDYVEAGPSTSNSSPMTKEAEKRDVDEAKEQTRSAGMDDMVLQAEETASGTPSISPPPSRKRTSSKIASGEVNRRRSERIKNTDGTADAPVYCFPDVSDDGSPVKRRRGRIPKAAAEKKRGRGPAKPRAKPKPKSSDDEEPSIPSKRRKTVVRSDFGQYFYDKLAESKNNTDLYPLLAPDEVQILDHFKSPVIRRAQVNKGTVCYAISMLQVMLRVPQIYSIIQSHSHILDQQECFLCMLCKIINQRPSVDDYDEFVVVLRTIWPGVNVKEMHCAMEAMQHFFDRFDADFTKFYPNYTANRELGYSFSRSFFHIGLTNIYTCSACEQFFEVEDNVIYLSCDLNQKCSEKMQKLVDNISMPTATSVMTCKKCHVEHDKFTCVTKFSKLPEVLLFFVPRVRSKKNEKDMTVVLVEKELNVKSMDGTNHKYSLSTFVTHHGDNGRKGHYKTFEVDHSLENKPYNEYDDGNVIVNTELTWDMTVVLAMFRRVDAAAKDDPIDAIYTGRGNVIYSHAKYAAQSAEITRGGGKSN